MNILTPAFLCSMFIGYIFFYSFTLNLCLYINFSAHGILLGLAFIIQCDGFCLLTELFGPFKFNVITDIVDISLSFCLFHTLKKYIYIFCFFLSSLFGINKIIFSISFILQIVFPAVAHDGEFVFRVTTW